MHSDSYDYSYAADDGYLYSGTDVLVNNFGIRDRAELCDAYIRSMHVSTDALESILDRTVTPA